jgi:hypothetical protein
MRPRKPSPTTAEARWPALRPRREMVASVPKWLAVHSPARRPPLPMFRPRRRRVSVADVDAHRAGGGAQAATGAGVEAHVEVVLAELAGASPAAWRRDSSRQPTMRWRGDRVSPWDGHCGSQKPHSMQRSTGVELGGGHGLEVLEVGLRVVVDDDAGVEQAFGVEELLDLLHQGGRPGCPIPARRRAPCCGRCRARPSASRRTW